MKKFIAKMKGGPPVQHGTRAVDVVWSSVGAFCGIMAVVWTNGWILHDTDLVMVVGSFGASAVLVYGAVKSPMSQPRNLVGGHVVSAIIGVTAYQLLHSHIWLAAPIAVAVAIGAMQLTRTLHPPGGATALIAVIGSQQIHELGYQYVLLPVGLGASVMLVIALLWNNIPPDRRYPESWR